MNHRFTAAALCFALGAVLAGPACCAAAEAPAAPTAAQASSESAAAQEFTDFASQMLDSILDGNVNFLDTHLDVPLLVNKTTAGFDLSATVLAGIQTKMRDKIKLGSQILQNIQEGDTFRLMRCVKDGNGAKAVIRYVGKEGGANWFEFHLIKKPDGQIVYDDVFIALNGALLSERLKQILYPILAHESAGTLTKLLSGRTSLESYVKALTTLQEATQLAQAGKAKEGFAKYCSLPDEQRYAFQFQVNALVIATPLGTESPEYNQLLTEVYDHSRENPGAQLMLVDYFFTKKNYAKMRECLDGTNKRFGPDAYIYYLLGASYFFEGNYGKAIDQYKAGRAIEPELTELYDQEAACHGKLADHTGMKALWLDFQKAFPEAKIESVFSGESEVLKSFLASPEYQQLLKECAAIRVAPEKDAPADKR